MKAQTVACILLHGLSWWTKVLCITTQRAGVDIDRFPNLSCRVQWSNGEQRFMGKNWGHVARGRDLGMQLLQRGSSRNRKVMYLKRSAIMHHKAKSKWKRERASNDLDTQFSFQLPASKLPHRPLVGRCAPFFSFLCARTCFVFAGVLRLLVGDRLSEQPQREGGAFTFIGAS